MFFFKLEEGFIKNIEKFTDFGKKICEITVILPQIE